MVRMRVRRALLISVRRAMTRVAFWAELVLAILILSAEAARPPDRVRDIEKCSGGEGLAANLRGL
jgi:hypothetical protein